MNPPQAMQVTVLVPVTNETSALRTTVDVVVGENPGRVHQVVILIAPTTTEASLQVANKLAAHHPKKVQVLAQTRPGLGGAFQDGLAAATGSHVLIMAADLETDPHLVHKLVATAEGGYDIVTATRWGQGGRFAQGLAPRQQALNWAFQKLCGALFGTQLTDLTYGFRLYRRDWVCGSKWPQDKHPFMLETVLGPLRMGAKVVEVPCVWRQRAESGLDEQLWAKMACLPVAIKTRFATTGRRHS